MPGDQQQAAIHHGPAHTDVAIRNQATQHRHGVDQCGVAAQYRQARVIREQMVFGEVQQQQVFHAVEGKAFPQLRTETDVEASGVSHEFATGGVAACCGFHRVIASFRCYERS